MRNNQPSGPTGCSSPPGEPPSPPVGPAYFHGEKISVCFGRLEPSYWVLPRDPRTRLVFTFSEALGRIESNWPNIFGDTSRILGPHQLCIVPPEQEATLDWLQRAELVVLSVEATAFAEGAFLPDTLMSEDFRPLARRDPFLAHLAQMFVTLCRQSAQPAPEFVEGIGLALASQTLKQCFSLGESNPSARSGLPPDTVSQIINYIDAHLRDTILVEDLARLAGLSPDHFARRFKITFGMGPKQFVLRRQMEKVRELLGTGRYNVTEAGREVGFHDPSHLNRCFRNIHGCSPIMVRKAALLSPGNN
jgi:AraC family transcriptional regulator